MGFSFYSIIGVVAGIISFVAYVIYVKESIWGKTSPNRATWGILTLVGVMIASSYYASGARDTIWIALVYIIGPLSIFIISLKHGEGGWTPFDRNCLIVVLISMILWWISKDPTITLLLNIGVDFVGLLPTVKKSYLAPIGEDKFAWELEAISSFVNLFAITTWTFAIVIYPIYLLLINGTIALLLIFRSKKFSKH